MGFSSPSSEGVKVVLNSEVDQAAKQGAQQAAKAVEKVSEATNTEQRIAAVTPEGVQSFVNAEIDQLAKNSGEQAVKAASKVEQEVAKETAKQAENIATKEVQNLAKNTQNLNPTKKELLRSKLNPNSAKNKIVRVTQIESGGYITSPIEWREGVIEHIFSSDHIADRIMNLGINQNDILQKIEAIIFDINKQKNSFILEASQIHTIINGCKVTIRVVIDINQSIFNIDAFIGHTSRTIGKLIEYYK